MSTKPDILIFLSEHHNARCGGFAGSSIVRTPNLDRLAREGTSFPAAYTAFPLCVPARLSFMTGQRCFRTDCYDNKSALAGDHATFMHSLAAAGYETVLCGRMHFRGYDQRHGFTKRIAGDFTPAFWGLELEWREVFGPLKNTFGKGGPLDLFGKGINPVLEYDKYVVEKALDYLQDDHEKPQCIVVGTYGPHPPYVGPEELYDYYQQKVDLPESFNPEQDFQHPAEEAPTPDMDAAAARDLRAAYFAMIEHTDWLIGQVKESWDGFLERNQRQGMLVYLSDHGEMAGERNAVGKTSLFEGSIRIPMIFSGAGIKSGQVNKTPVSLMDVGPTLCALVDATQLPEQDGGDLSDCLSEGAEYPERPVFVDMVTGQGHNVGIAVRQDRWKYISYHDFAEHDMLFDVESDPYELHNLKDEQPQVTERMRRIIADNWCPEHIRERVKVKYRHIRLLCDWGQAARPCDSEQWLPGDYDYSSIRR